MQLIEMVEKNKFILHVKDKKRRECDSLHKSILFLRGK